MRPIRAQTEVVAHPLGEERLSSGSSGSERGFPHISCLNDAAENPQMRRLFREGLLPQRAKPERPCRRNEEGPPYRAGGPSMGGHAAERILQRALNQ
jgi:hypothetical protein